MNFSIRIYIAAALVTSLAGCSSTTGPKEEVGTLVGAAVGGVIGSQLGDTVESRLIGSVAGAVIGGAIGNRIGASLDAEDQRQLERITRDTIRTGTTRTYASKRTGIKARTKVTGVPSAKNGQCRTVEQEVVLASGQVMRDSVSACKGKNGWDI